MAPWEKGTLSPKTESLPWRVAVCACGCEWGPRAGGAEEGRSQQAGSPHSRQAAWGASQVWAVPGRGEKEEGRRAPGGLPEGSGPSNPPSVVARAGRGPRLRTVEEPGRGGGAAVGTEEWGVSVQAGWGRPRTSAAHGEPHPANPLAGRQGGGCCAGCLRSLPGRPRQVRTAVRGPDHAGDAAGAAGTAAGFLQRAR